MSSVKTIAPRARRAYATAHAGRRRADAVGQQQRPTLTTQRGHVDQRNRGAGRAAHADVVEDRSRQVERGTQDAGEGVRWAGRGRDGAVCSTAQATKSK